MLSCTYRHISDRGRIFSQSFLSTEGRAYSPILIGYFQEMQEMKDWCAL